MRFKFSWKSMSSSATVIFRRRTLLYRTNNLMSLQYSFVNQNLGWYLIALKKKEEEEAL
jgi:hypothetical protein